MSPPTTRFWSFPPQLRTKPSQQKTASQNRRIKSFSYPRLSWSLGHLSVKGYPRMDHTTSDRSGERDKSPSQPHSESHTGIEDVSPIRTSCRIMPQVSSPPVQVFTGPEQLFPMLWHISHWRQVPGKRRTHYWAAVIRDLTSSFTDVWFQHWSALFTFLFPSVSLRNLCWAFPELLMAAALQTPFILADTQVSLDSQIPNSIFVENKDT